MGVPEKGRVHRRGGGSACPCSDSVWEWGFTGCRLERSLYVSHTPHPQQCSALWRSSREMSQPLETLHRPSPADPLHRIWSGTNRILQLSSVLVEICCDRLLFTFLSEWEWLIKNTIPLGEYLFFFLWNVFLQLLIENCLTFSYFFLQPVTSCLLLLLHSLLVQRDWCFALFLSTC